MRKQTIIKTAMTGLLFGLMLLVFVGAAFTYVYRGNVQTIANDQFKWMLFNGTTGVLELQNVGTGWQNNLAILDPSSTVTTTRVGWTQTTGTGWTFTLAGNSRDAASSIVRIVSDTTTTDVATLALVAAVDLRKYDYIGAWIYSATAIGATEFTVVLANSAGTAITGCTALVFPAMTATDEMFISWNISACTARSAVKYIRIAAASGVAAETIDIDQILAYKMSNGRGPALGPLVDMAVSSATVTQGEWVELDPLATAPARQGVRTATANAYNVVGVACTTGHYLHSDHILVQTGGMVVADTAGAVSDNALVEVAAATTLDDAGSAQDAIGYATEAAADAGDQIYVMLRRLY